MLLIEEVKIMVESSIGSFQNAATLHECSNYLFEQLRLQFVPDQQVLE